MFSKSYDILKIMFRNFLFTSTIQRFFRCWWQMLGTKRVEDNFNMLVSHQWWRFWPFWPPTSTIFSNKRRAPKSKFCHQHPIIFGNLNIKAHFWNVLPNLILDGSDKNQEISFTKHILDLTSFENFEFFWKNLLPLAESESKRFKKAVCEARTKLFFDCAAIKDFEVDFYAIAPPSNCFIHLSEGNLGNF